MLKLAYQKETRLENTLAKGSAGADVRRVQEWLCLNALRYPNAALATNADGQFGPATERAVRNVQRVLRVSQTGHVTPELFAVLSAPMSTAFGTKPTGNDIRKAVLQVARMHLRQRAAELQTDDAQNLGPWVRAYCDEYEGSPFKWCVGFVQTILDQVASHYGRQFTNIMPHTLSCDIMAQSGRENGRLIENERLRHNPERIQPGDVFLIRNRSDQADDWFHAGLIASVAGEVVETIEGNTDTKGGSNGTAVFARVRNFQTTTLDVFSIDGL
jgi:hypothetical protein